MIFYSIKTEGWELDGLFSQHKGEGAFGGSCIKELEIKKLNPPLPFSLKKFAELFIRASRNVLYVILLQYRNTRSFMIIKVAMNFSQPFHGRSVSEQESNITSVVTRFKTYSH